MLLESQCYEDFDVLGFNLFAEHLRSQVFNESMRMRNVLSSFVSDIYVDLEVFVRV